MIRTLYITTPRLHHSHMRLLLTLILTFITTASHALEVRNLRIGTHPDKTRIVLELDSIDDFRAFTLADPYRIVLDMPRLNWNIATPSATKAGITNIRHGKLAGNLSRIVFDMNKPVKLTSVFALPAAESRPNRLVLDYTNTTAAAFPQTKEKIFGTLETTADRAEIPAGSLTSRAPPPPPVRSKAKPIRKKIIVIDPGHGGQDPGAVSGRTYEKNITFALSKLLKKELEKSGNYEVHLTRYSDKFIKLFERVRIAQRHNADLFISVHADSINKSSVRGASIYTLSEKASDAQTARLAARENKADMIPGMDLSHEDAQVASILIDLVQRDTMNQSNYFAEKMVKEFKSSGIRMLENPHRSAGFAVLKAPDIPSVLIEAGFISNRQDAKLLNSQSHREKIARTISGGITRYLNYIHKSQKM